MLKKQIDKNERVDFSSVPEGVSFEILKFLSTVDLAKMAGITKPWKQIVDNSPIWRFKLYEEFGCESSLINKLRAPKQLYLHLYKQKQKFLQKNAWQKFLDRLISADFIPLTADFLEGEISIVEGAIYLNMAAEVGNFTLIKWLTDNDRGNLRVSPAQITLYRAIQSDNVELVSWLLQSFPNLMIDAGAFNLAAHQGNIDIMNVLLGLKKQPIKFDQHFINTAASSGSVNFFEWLFQHTALLDAVPIQATIEIAARSGHFELVKWLLNASDSNGWNLKVDHSLLNQAALSGKKELVDWLMIEKGVPPSDTTLIYAAQGGNLLLNQALIKRGLKPSFAMFEQTVLAGDIKSTEWLLHADQAHFGLQPTKRIIDLAARSGNLELVEFLLSTYRIIPDEQTLIAAAGSGNLKLVKWMLGNDRSFRLEPTSDVVLEAVKSESLILVRWLFNNFSIEINSPYLLIAEARKSENRFLLSELEQRLGGLLQEINNSHKLRPVIN